MPHLHSLRQCRSHQVAVGKALGIGLGFSPSDDSPGPFATGKPFTLIVPEGFAAITVVGMHAAPASALVGIADDQPVLFTAIVDGRPSVDALLDGRTSFGLEASAVSFRLVPRRRLEELRFPRQGAEAILHAHEAATGMTGAGTQQVVNPDAEGEAAVADQIVIREWFAERLEDARLGIVHAAGIFGGAEAGSSLDPHLVG